MYLSVFVITFSAVLVITVNRTLGITSKCQVGIIIQVEYPWYTWWERLQAAQLLIKPAEIEQEKKTS